jgi:hypothetical protein
MSSREDEVRREFEAWATKEEFSVTRNNPLGQYDDFAVEARWTVWQAALSSPAVVAMVEALRKATQFVEAHSEEGGYGFARPSNPHDFSPDQECCTPEEISNHKAACEAFDRGDYQHDEWDGWNEDHTIHVLKAPWGIGIYTMRDKWAGETLDKARAALAQYATLAGEKV